MFTFDKLLLLTSHLQPTFPRPSTQRKIDKSGQYTHQMTTLTIILKNTYAKFILFK